MEVLHGNISIDGANQALVAEHVAAIRQLGRQTTTNIIEIGRRLTECKKMVGKGNFGCWLDNEFGWAERTAQNFMRVFELSNPNPQTLRI